MKRRLKAVPALLITLAFLPAPLITTLYAHCLYDGLDGFFRTLGSEYSEYFDTLRRVFMTMVRGE